MNPRCGMWLVVFLGTCVLSLSQGRGRGLRSLLCPSTCVCPLPRGQRHRFCVRACTQTTATVAPDYNTSSSRFASMVAGPGACLPQRANPTLALGRTRPFKVHTAAVLRQQHHSVRKCKDVVVIILATKWSLHFRTVRRNK